MSLNNSFDTLIDATYENIDGSLVQKGVNPKTGNNVYVWNGCFYDNIESLRKAMKGIYAIISLSIINPNGEEISLGKEFTDLYSKGESPYEKYKAQ